MFSKMKSLVQIRDKKESVLALNQDGIVQPYQGDKLDLAPRSLWHDAWQILGHAIDTNKISSHSICSCDSRMS